MTREESMHVVVLGRSDRLWKISKPLKSIGVNIDEIKLSNKIELLRAYKLINKSSPDIIITDSISKPGVATFILSLLSSSTFVIRIRGDRITERYSSLTESVHSRSISGIFNETKSILVTSILLLLTKNHVFVSKYHSNNSIVGQLSGSNTTAIPTPVDLPKISKIDHSTNENIILAVSNFNFRKKTEGLIDGLDQIADVLNEHPTWKLYVAGSGDYFSDLKEHVESLDIDSINLLGYVDEVDHYYQISSIFIHLSYLDKYPSTVLEASSWGLPSIANSGYGMDEQIVDEQTGYIVDLDNSTELYESLDYLISNKSTRVRLGENARNFVEMNNSYANIGKHFLEYFNNTTE